MMDTELHYAHSGFDPKSVPAMDALDLRLIALLRADARRSIASLAEETGVARATVQNRIDKLIERRIIQGFTVRTAPEVAPHRVRAVMLVAVEGEHTAGVIKELRGYPEVLAVHSTNGRWDLVVELATDGLEQFDAALRRIRTIRGIANSETSLLLHTHHG